MFLATIFDYGPPVTSGLGLRRVYLSVMFSFLFSFSPVSFSPLGHYFFSPKPPFDAIVMIRAGRGL